MFLRALLTIASLTVATVAVLIVECWSTVIDFATNDPLRVCSTMSAAGLDYGIGIGIGLALLAGLCLVGTWVPAAQPPHLKRKPEPGESLRHNLERLADVGIKTTEIEDMIPSEVHMARLSRRLEAIESAIARSRPSRETTYEWMRLLREANDLHISGSLSTLHFNEINTRGLDLFSIPDRDEVPGTV